MLQRQVFIAFDPERTPRRRIFQIRGLSSPSGALLWLKLPRSLSGALFDRPDIAATEQVGHLKKYRNF